MTSRLTRLGVENYQSIGSADVAIGGLTVIVGRGNLGKSALLRAMTAALFNETGTAFIRQGTKKTTVTLNFEGDQEVVWTKDEKTARYDVTVAGAEMPFTKLAGKVPAELEDLFGIRNIEIDSTFSIKPQIHGQFDQPLLLAETASKAARALGKLTKLDGILSAQQAAAKDMRRARADAGSRGRETEELTARLAEFPDIPKIERYLSKAREGLQEADSALNQLGAAEDAEFAIRQAKRRLAVAIPERGELETLQTRLARLETAADARNRLITARARERAARTAKTEANLELQSAEADLEKYMLTLGQCPTCGQEIKVTHTHV